MQDVLRPGLGAPSAPKAPKLMGRFRCESLLHGEGMLETWRARVQGLAGFDRMFAVKCLIPGSLSRRPHAAEDLLLSARTVAKLKDARFAGVMDSGLAPGSAFVATELIHGVSLRALREYVYGRASEDGGRPTAWPAMLLHLGAEIAGALAAAHGAPGALVHGALAAGSVMVTPQGGIKVLDLGLFASVHTPAEIAASPVRRPCAAPGAGPGRSSDHGVRHVRARRADVRAGHGSRASHVGPEDPGPSWSRVLAAEQQALVRQLLSFEPSERPGADQAESVLREGVAAFGGLDVRASSASWSAGRCNRTWAVLNRRPPRSAVSPAGKSRSRKLHPGRSIPGSSRRSRTSQPRCWWSARTETPPSSLASCATCAGKEKTRKARSSTGPAAWSRRISPPHRPARRSFPQRPTRSPRSRPRVKRVSDDDQDPGFESVETRIQGVPYAELTDVTTGEITLGLEDALAARAALANASPEVDAPIDVEPPTAGVESPIPLALEHRPQSSPASQAPRAIQFVEFSSDMAAGSRHLTPSGWRPTGNLEDPTETDHRPLHDEIIGRGRGKQQPAGWRGSRLGRVVLTTLAVAALAAGVAAAIRFVASRPPATVPPQVHSAAR